MFSVTFTAISGVQSIARVSNQLRGLSNQLREYPINCGIFNQLREYPINGGSIQSIAGVINQLRDIQSTAGVSNQLREYPINWGSIILLLLLLSNQLREYPINCGGNQSIVRVSNQVREYPINCGSIRLNSQELSSSPSVRDLGVIIDSDLTLTTHVSILARTCFYHLRRIRQAKEKPGRRLCQNISPCTCSLTPGLLQLGTGQLARSDACTTHRVQHSAARLIQNLQRKDSVSLVMMELHWLPLHHRITFKLCTLMHGIHHGHCPKYMKEMVLPVSTLPGRERLRFSRPWTTYDICRIKLREYPIKGGSIQSIAEVSNQLREYPINCRSIQSDSNYLRGI